MQEIHAMHGACHCGNVRIAYETVVAPEQARPRACQCSFCRKQNTRTVSDPAGRLEFLVRDGEQLARYRFALGLSDYLVCRICGVYVGSFMADPDDRRGLATLMVNVLDEERRFPAPEPISYDGESEDAKRERRRQRWTPARLVVGA